MLGAACLVLMLSACMSSDSSKPSLEELSQQSLSTLDGVESVAAHQTAVTADTSDRSDPDAWALDIDVAMTLDVTADQVAAAASAIRDFTTEHVGSAGWVAHLRVGASTAVPDEDRSGLSPVQVDVYPEVRTSAAADVRDAMSIRTIDRVGSVAITNRVISVQVPGADDLWPVLGQLRVLPVWTDGGSVQTETGRVRMADVPDRITADQARAFFEVSAAHPDADFAIESSGRAPEVYVNRVTIAQAREITASFTSPELSSTTSDGFKLEFNIRASDANESADTHGTFGEPQGT